MNSNERMTEIEADVNNLITRFNTQQAMAFGLMHALASITRTLPGDTRNQLRTQYETICGTFQNVVTLGKTDLDALQIQRDEFRKIGDIVFGGG